MNNPGSYVPPAPPAKKRPSCWVLGSLGCLGVLIIAGAAIVYGFYSFSHSKAGSQFGTVFGKAMQVGINTADAEKKLTTIRLAVLQYKSANGKYPKNLQALVPTYIPDSTVLHSALDANPDPAHVSFTYVKPAANAPNSTEFLDISWNVDLGVTTSQITTTEYLSETLGGQLVTAEYQNGKLIMRTANPSPPGTP